MPRADIGFVDSDAWYRGHVYYLASTYVPSYANMEEFFNVHVDEGIATATPVDSTGGWVVRLYVVVAGMCVP